mmetsp:Transcript_55245/g.103631  ORF Transcript_55245/g.103631 Transcript_55245/m.103631 type:complete len:307 (-) Transcript_55245:386-1306(-)
MCFRKHEMLKADGHRHLQTVSDPAVAEDMHHVLRRQRLRDGDGEAQHVGILVAVLRLLPLFARNGHVLRVVDALPVPLRVPHPHPERLAVAVLPLEGWVESHREPQDLPRDGLHVHFAAQARQNAVRVEDLQTQPLEVDQGTDLARVHVKNLLHGGAPGFQLLQNGVGDSKRVASASFLQLAQRALPPPQPPVDALRQAKVERRQGAVAFSQGHFEQRPAHPGPVLRHVVAVAHQRKTCWSHLGNVRLQQHAHFAWRVVSAAPVVASAHSACTSFAAVAAAAAVAAGTTSAADPAAADADAAAASR